MKKNKTTIILQMILTIIIVTILIRQIMLKEWFFALACLFTLLIMIIPKLLNKKFRIELPATLEITVYLFVFAAEIMGEVNEYYLTVPWWDDVLHLISGFVLGGIGIFLIDLLHKKNNYHFKLAPFCVVVISLCFSVAILTFWEVFEYAADKIIKSDMQKDTIITEISSVVLNENYINSSVTEKIETLTINGEDWMKKYGGYIDIGLNDTMSDLILGIVGASIYSLFAYIYLKKKNQKNIAANFIPKYNIN